jgi:hypothetical protein
MAARMAAKGTKGAVGKKGAAGKKGKPLPRPGGIRSAENSPHDGRASR